MPDNRIDNVVTPETTREIWIVNGATCLDQFGCVPATDVTEHELAEALKAGRVVHD